VASFAASPETEIQFGVLYYESVLK